MFSLFRRSSASKPQAGDDDAEVTENRRYHHSRIPDARDLSAYLKLEDDGPPIVVELLDMNIQGAGLKVPFHLSPDSGRDQFVELVVSHALDGWRVSSLARVLHVTKIDDQHVKVGIQFANLGDLYAQLDDALGRYFNRRTTLRVKPELEDEVRVKTSYEHHRLHGKAHDLSRTGVGVRMSLVQAAIFKTGESVRLRIELPSAPALEGPAFVRHGYRVGQDVVLGMEFDLSASCSLTRQRKLLDAYIAQRELAAQQFQIRLMQGR